MAPDANDFDRTFVQPSSIKHSPNRSVPPTLETQYNQSRVSMRPSMIGHHGQLARNPTASLPTLLPGSTTSAGYIQQDSQHPAVPGMPPYSIPYLSNYSFQNPMRSPRPPMPAPDSFYGHGHHGPSYVNLLAQSSEQQVDSQLLYGNISSKEGEYSLQPFFPSQLSDATATPSYQQYPNTLPAGSFHHGQVSYSVIDRGLQTNYTSHNPQAVHGHRKPRYDTAPNEDPNNASYQGNWASEPGPQQ
jgi:hypothetical protein